VYRDRIETKCSPVAGDAKNLSDVVSRAKAASEHSAALPGKSTKIVKGGTYKFRGDIKQVLGAYAKLGAAGVIGLGSTISFGVGAQNLKEYRHSLQVAKWAGKSATDEMMRGLGLSQ